MISIITITYNNPEDLERTLNSVPRNAFIESVVINGGDDKRSIDFLSSYNGIVINEKDRGISDAFNKGVSNSTGKYIMFLNSGDELLVSSYPEEAIRIFEADNSIGFVHSNLLFVDSIGGELVMPPRLKNPGRGMPYNHPTMIVRREVFDKIGMFSLEYKIAMDFDFIIRMQKESIKGKYINNERPVVKMDGRGKSAVNEFDAIRECYHSLKKNKMLSFTNTTGILIRFSFYFIRRLMIILKAESLLSRLKHLKYSGKK